MKLSQSEALPSNKKFGYFFSLVFLILGFVFHSYFFIISFIFILLVLLKPDYLRVFNELWFSLGLLLSKIFNPIIMGIIFYGLFTPIGLIMRLLGRDELGLKKNKQSTYWKQKKFSNDSFNNQY